MVGGGGWCARGTGCWGRGGRGTRRGVKGGGGLEVAKEGISKEAGSGGGLKGGGWGGVGWGGQR